MNEEKAVEAVAHLQRAALEMIAAARAMLDLAEEMVKDPAPLIAAAATLAEAARNAGAHVPAADAPEPESRVQHIRVS